jgi:superfamily I DNA and RNA helicase
VARGLGEGHRIIRGVAGSGKTLILAFRAEYLARAASKPVLILCFANGIAGRLEDAMQERGVEDRVQVRTFHSWCYQMLKTYRISGPTEAEYPNYNDRLAALVRYVEAETMLGHIPGGQYDAVLIDEANDFEPEWLSLAVKMVSPNTKAFLIAYDDMQAIYKGMGRPVWSQLGIEAKGRTRVQGQPREYRADFEASATNRRRGGSMRRKSCCSGRMELGRFQTR